MQVVPNVKPHMEELKLEIENYIQSEIDAEWRAFSSRLLIQTASKRETIFRQTEICNKVIYILGGIAASEYNEGDKYLITRFFQFGDLCSNMVSASTKRIHSDNVIAITKLHANVTSNTSEKLKFRLNLYDIEKGLPNEKLINQNIIFSIDTKEGGFTLDLSEYDIVVEDDFFLTEELIENEGNKESEVFFSAGLLGNATVTRLTSQAEWEKLGSVGIGFSVTAKY